MQPSCLQRLFRKKEESTVLSNIDNTRAIEVTALIMALATIPPKEESAVLSDIAGTARDVKATPSTEEFSEPINNTGTRAVEETTMSLSNNPPTGKSAVPLSTTGTGAVDETKLNTLPSEESIVPSTTRGTQDTGTEETTMPAAPADTPAAVETPCRRRARLSTEAPAGPRRSRRPFRNWPRSFPAVSRGNGVFGGAGGDRENRYSRSMENQYGQGQHYASNLGYYYGPNNDYHYGADSFGAIDPSYASYNGTAGTSAPRQPSMDFRSGSRNFSRGRARINNRGNPNRGDNSSSGRPRRPSRGFENRWNS